MPRKNGQENIKVPTITKHNDILGTSLGQSTNLHVYNNNTSPNSMEHPMELGGGGTEKALIVKKELPPLKYKNPINFPDSRK